LRFQARNLQFLPQAVNRRSARQDLLVGLANMQASIQLVDQPVIKDKRYTLSVYATLSVYFKIKHVWVQLLRLGQNDLCRDLVEQLGQAASKFFASISFGISQHQVAKDKRMRIIDVSIVPAFHPKSKSAQLVDNWIQLGIDWKVVFFIDSHHDVCISLCRIHTTNQPIDMSLVVGYWMFESFVASEHSASKASNKLSHGGCWVWIVFINTWLNFDVQIDQIKCTQVGLVVWSTHICSTYMSPVWCV